MPRKPQHSDHQLSYALRTRISKKTWENLQTLRKQSDTRTISELARRILSQEKVTTFTRDATFDATAEQLALIYRELKAMGTNINQVARNFNQTDQHHRKAWHSEEIARIYAHANARITLTLGLISQLSKSWLQR